jgi:methionine-rich copper-binding protein CopC
MRRLIVLTDAALLGMVGLTGTALAHNVLVDSNPKQGSTVDAGPPVVTLTFDQPVQEGEQFNSIVVIGPNGDHWEGGRTTVDGRTVSVPLRPLGPAGKYQIGYQILSDDGHPVRAQVAFTLAKAGSGTPTPGTSTVSQDSGGGLPVWVWIVGAVVLLGVGVTLALRSGSPREPVE